MRPPHRRQVGEKGWVKFSIDQKQMLHRPVEVTSVPIRNRRDQQVEARGPVFLIFERTVRKPALPVGVDSGGERVPRFALVEPGLAGTAQLRLFEPVKRE